MPSRSTPSSPQTPSDTDRQSADARFWGALLGVLVLVEVILGTEHALHFGGPPMDGPFQLFNALRRIAAGQRAGRDFQFFHGIGVPYLHYPLFRLFGGSLAASEGARQLVAILAYPFVLVAFFAAFTRDRVRTLALAALAYGVSLYWPLDVLTTPAVSMLGLRSSVATLVPAAMYAPISDRHRRWLTGITLGLALVLGTEQGLAALAAFVVVGGLRAIRTSRRTIALDTAVTAAIGIATLVITALVIAGPHGAMRALRYNYVLVPQDQSWYFGAPASIFASTWHSVWRLMYQMPRIPATLTLATIAVVWQIRRVLKDPEGDAGRRHAALAVLAAYGLLSCASLLGIFFDTYVEPCMRALLLLGAVALDAWLDRRSISPWGTWRGSSPPRLMKIAFAAGLLAIPNALSAITKILPYAIHEQLIARRGPTLSALWPATLAAGQAVMDAHREPDGRPPTLWSTYAGLLEARNGSFNPSGFDYAFHALGPANRRAYVADFVRARPTIVQTMTPMYIASEVWMVQTSWEFYDALLRQYAVAGTTPWSTLWVRLPAPKPAPRLLASITPPHAAASVTLPIALDSASDARPQLVEVELQYRVRNRLRLLPVIGTTPRYFVTIGNATSRFPVTLDPYTTVAHFPIVVESSARPTLAFRTYALFGGASFDVSRVRVFAIPVDAANASWVASLRDAERQRWPAGPGNDTTGRYEWR